MKLKEVVGFAKIMLSPEEVAELVQYRQGDNEDEISDELFDKLFNIYLNSGEMPYGTAKARTGDPHQWIADKIVDMSEFEFSRFLQTHSATTKLPRRGSMPMMRRRSL